MNKGEHLDTPFPDSQADFLDRNIDWNPTDEIIAGKLRRNVFINIFCHSDSICKLLYIDFLTKFGMLLHIADHIGKAVAGDTGIAEKLSVTDNDQGPFRAGEGNIQPCFLFQESDTPLIAASDGGVDDDVTLTALECIHGVDIDFNVAQWDLLEAVPD